MVEFNKMFVMLPVMFLARKLDAEDPMVVYWLRISYACMQAICACLVAYTYWQATAVKADRVVYVPAPAVVSCVTIEPKHQYQCQYAQQEALG